MTAKTPISGRAPVRLPRLVDGAAAVALLLLTVGPAAARTRDNGTGDPGASHYRLSLPSSVTDVTPVFEQHSRGGGSSGGGHAVPRGGSGGGGGSSTGGGSGIGGSGSGGSVRSGGSSSGTPTGQASGGSAQPRDGGGTTAGQGGSSGGGTPTYTKPRNGQPVTGTAVRRQPGDVPPGAIDGGGYYPIYYPWGWGGIGVGAYYGGYDPWGWGDPYSTAAASYDYDGKLKLKVKPRQAEVLVDGYFAGSVDDYDGTFQELHLEPGPHRIEIRLEGFESLSFEVRILPDQTVTYKGELRKRVTTDTSAAGASTDRTELPAR